MKRTLLLSRTITQLIVAPVAMGLAIVATGCAGSRYDRSTGESIDDRSTTSRVKSALNADSLYKYPDVKVTTFKGTVQLSGFVDTKEQKSKAGDIVKGVTGVKEIENNITVKP
jgi:hyperosmotically inducible periplasmic protein